MKKVKERICVESTENRRAGVETGAGICIKIQEVFGEGFVIFLM
jgi:hypothetical protein